MSFMWFVAWLFARRPKVQMFGRWNRWGIALAVCMVTDFTSSLGNVGKSIATRRTRSRTHDLPLPEPAANGTKTPEAAGV
jgi:hypothetical protein